MSNLQLTQEKLDALRSEYRPRRPCALLKYPRPKTKPEYQAIYPWLLPDETDPHFVFCAVCECRLSCKRSDLGKHEGSIKHSENAQRKAMPVKENHTEAEGSAAGELPATITPIHTTPSYAARQLQSYQLQQMSPITPQRDSLELFFDSICATVKSLPPKLATGGKIRVMQLIGELELRALGEQEASSQCAGPQGLDLAGSSASGAAEAPGSGQQNATVASTTK
ncbi:protein suppressor of variegation 3-7-like [Drosophila subpulchrella]|uniref:protein suppressor of variegation 3-7-like n=1 Tax=Drosophila subpulchrella TaxID=1486046 RepID=UPI0018A1817C|nr:protein suppressor of variegation 3-7-like [Drosophila subpulchrella]